MSEFAHGRIEYLVDLVDAVVNPGIGRLRRHLIAQMNGLARRFLHRGVDLAAHAREQRRAERRPLRFLQGYELLAVNIRLDPAPGGTSRAAAGSAYLGHGNLELLENFE